MNIHRLIPPAEEPISLDEAKAFCRIDADLTEDDALLAGFILFAREYVEDMTSRALAPQTVQVVFDGFPRERSVNLPRFPVIEVEKVEYETVAGDVLNFDDYDVATHTMPGVLFARRAWPAAARNRGSVRITYRCGHGAMSDDDPPVRLTPPMPEMARQAMLFMINHLYEQRETVVVGRTASEIPLGVTNIIRQLNVWYGR